MVLTISIAFALALAGGLAVLASGKGHSGPLLSLMVSGAVGWAIQWLWETMFDDGEISKPDRERERDCSTGRAIREPLEAGLRRIGRGGDDAPALREEEPGLRLEWLDGGHTPSLAVRRPVVQDDQRLAAGQPHPVEEGLQQQRPARGLAECRAHRDAQLFPGRAGCTPLFS